MDRIIKHSALALVLLLLCAGPGFAMATPYGTATHTTTDWQELATQTSGSGVYWSINGSAYGHNTSLTVGDSIQFQFNMHKQNVGTHYADFVKAWVDWDQDSWFNRKDVVIFAKQELSENESGNLGSDATPNVSDYTFYSAIIPITEKMIGELFLRARVTCSESVTSSMGLSWGSQWHKSDEWYNENFKPTGELGQGEVEEWTLTVSKTPIPASLLLFGTGLLGLVTASRNRFKKF